jgi:hypothetical protein
MTVEYVVLGAVLIAMGIVQTWIRHGPWGKELRAEQAEIVARRAQRAEAAREAAARTEEGKGDEADDAGAVDAAAAAVAVRERELTAKVDKRAGKAWSAWTAVLGPLSMAFGIALLVLGLLGY